VDTTLFDISFRVYSTLDNPNVLGEYFLLVIPLAVAFMFSAKSWPKRIMWLCAVGIMMLCLVLTYSRGCWVGIIVAAAIFLVMLDRRFILLGVAVLIAAPFVLPENIMQRLTSIGNMADDSTSYRVYIWLGTIAMLRHYWFSGVGPGETAYNKIYPIYSYNSIKSPHAHNLFLQVTSDAGICGLVTLLLAFFSYFRTLATGVRNEAEQENKIFQIAGIASMAGFIVQSMFDYTFYNYRVMLMMWGYMALFLLFTKLRQADSKEAAV
jgi:O-antigen ligase